MLVETRRRFITHTLPGLFLAACTAEATSQDEKRIKLARSMQISSRETMIPMPDFGRPVDIQGTYTSFGTNRLEIHFPEDMDGFIFPSLVEGEIRANIDYGLGKLTKVKVKMGNMFWIFETAGVSLVPKGGELIKLGDPLFRLDFSRYTKEAGDGYEKSLMFIRAIESPDDAKEVFSKIGRANILKNPDNTYVTIPLRKTA